MALPLLLFSAAALTVAELATERRSTERRRRYMRGVATLDRLSRHESVVASYPSEVLQGDTMARPAFGAVVCCGIAGVLDHTGIWIDDDTIVELDGSGLIKPISSARFIAERSGRQIFIACDSQGHALADSAAAERAIAQIYQFQPYHLVNNNCHQFVWRCFEPDTAPLTTFKTLNQRLAHHFNRQVYWDRLLLPSKIWQ